MTKILIVEDEQIIAEDIADSLRCLGYDVVGMAATAKNALIKARETKPDLVLMDIMLKGQMDGINAAAQMREDLDIPVVYLTAYADDQTLEKATLTEPFGYLIKPFSDQDLRSTIEIALKRYHIESKVRNQLTTTRELQQKAELERDMQSEYVSIVSHEFRNPLTTILGAAELIKNYGRDWDEDKKQKYFDRIQNAIHNMTQMIDDLLTIGQGNAGQISFDPQPLDVIALCRELISIMQQTIGTKHEIILDIQGENDTVLLDERLLDHILTNLLSNAIKYSPEGKEVRLDVQLSDSEVIFVIKDQGIGIPQDKLERLFEPFKRANNVGKIPGTGLGLAIVKQSVDLHKGKIFVESKINFGTTFTVILPVNN
ncbi:MAG TPA: ATP-binding protein [Allocoleopsis sp.]